MQSTNESDSEKEYLERFTYLKTAILSCLAEARADYYNSHIKDNIKENEDFRAVHEWETMEIILNNSESKETRDRINSMKLPRRSNERWVR